MEVSSSFLSGSHRFSHHQQQQELNRSKNFAATLTMRIPIKKKNLWSIVSWCFSKLRIIQSAQDSLSAGVAVDLRKEDFWTNEATQERKSSNVQVSILKFLKKYYLSSNCRSFTSENKLFSSLSWKIFLIQNLFLRLFLIWYCLLLIKLDNRIYCRRSKKLIGRKRLLSACISIWMESHKICKIWVLTNQVLSQYFCSYELWLNKSNHRVKQVDISESTDINQSISMNRFYPIEA